MYSFILFDQVALKKGSRVSSWKERLELFRKWSPFHLHEFLLIELGPLGLFQILWLLIVPEEFLNIVGQLEVLLGKLLNILGVELLEAAKVDVDDVGVGVAVWGEWLD